MPIFHLQRHAKEGRLVIDTEIPADVFEVMKTLIASEWLEAKQLMGFKLTPEQARLLKTPLADRLEKLKQRSTP